MFLHHQERPPAEVTGSDERCIEMAGGLGFVKHFDGRLKSGQLYVGWVDSKSGDPVDDKDVKPRYEESILEHTGIRLLGEWI